MQRLEYRPGLVQDGLRGIALEQEPVYALSFNVLLYESGPTSGKAEAIKAEYPQAFERVLARCVAQPVGLYWDALKSESPGKR